ncbi:MAG: glycosyltransferase [Pleurocapsa sp.]
MKAEWLTPSAWYGHVPFAFWLIENLQPKTFVELGTHYGVSFCAFNQAIQKLQLNTKSYAVDTWEGDEHSGLYGEEVFTQLSAYHDPKYGSLSRLIRSTFDQAVSHFPDQSIDLLHIDGLHTYEAVKHDYETWFTKLSDRAIVVFHDINVRERGFGVWQLWQELSQQYPHFSFLHYHGLGVLGVGKNLPENAFALFEANSNSELVFQIRESFVRLGTAVAESWSKQEQQKEVAELAVQLQQTQSELSKSQQQLQQTEAELNQSQRKLQQTQSELSQSQQQLQKNRHQQTQLQNLITAMESSKFWQMRTFWLNGKQALNLNHKDEVYQAYLNSLATNNSSIPSVVNSTLNYRIARLQEKGWEYIFTKIFRDKLPKLAKSLVYPEPLVTRTDEDIPPSKDSKYQQWLNKHYPRQIDLTRMSETLSLLSYQPKISIIVPVYNPPEAFFRQAIESVLKQIYPDWELCLADDCSTKPYVKEILEEYAQKDSRIKVVFREENGHISRASNSALEIATGEYIALLDHDDLLAPHALYEMVMLLNQHPEADMIYSDEDKIDETNWHKDPFFKMDWCPDSFLTRMYTCHLGVYRRSIITEIGNFRVGFEGSQDYDLVLRFTEKTNKIFHIPKVLYHWRIHSESAASGASAKPYAYEAAQKALSEALVRRKEPGKIIPVSGYPGLYTTRYEIKEKQLVSIIIPTRDLSTTLNTCLKSIFIKTTYPNYEVIVIDNGSQESATFECFESWKKQEPARFKCYRYDIPFNYSQINNYAVEKSQGNYLLFLNNDTEIISNDWVEAMVEQAQRPSIGAVGALLLYPDKTIQHAGVVLGIGGVANHSHKGYPSLLPGYFCQVITINNYSAVTGACLMCRREVFKEVSGFEEQLAVAFNDVDFCLKLVEKGYRNIYLPHVVLYHYESKSRGKDDSVEKQMRFTQEINYMQTNWEKLIENDPCYSPHLTRDSEDYTINVK